MANDRDVHPSEVHRLIAVARGAATFPDDDRQGWQKSRVDPRTLLAVFSSLKPGYTLRAYSFAEGGNGNAFVYAMPMDAPFPEPETCPRDTSAFLEPPVPP